MASAALRVKDAPARARQPGPPPTRDSTEEVVARLHRSGRRLVWPSIWFIAVCGLTGFAWDRFPLAWLDTALPVVAVALIVLLTLAPLARWANHVTLITTRRLIVKQGFVVRQRTEFVLGHGATASLRRSPVQVLGGGGDVIVHAGADGTLILRDVPRPKLVLRAVADLIDAAVGTAVLKPTTRRPFVN